MPIQDKIRSVKFKKFLENVAEYLETLNRKFCENMMKLRAADSREGLVDI